LRREHSILKNQSHHHPSPLHLDELKNTLQERAASKRGELERCASLNQEEKGSKRLDQLIVNFDLKIKISQFYQIKALTQSIHRLQTLH
jgi:hypothetical protein